MAEHQLEAAQRVLRKTDYEFDDDASEEFRSVASVEMAAESKNRLAAFDPLHQQQPTQKPPPSEHALFDDCSVGAMTTELTNLNDTNREDTLLQPASAGFYLEMEGASHRPAVASSTRSTGQGGSALSDLAFLDNDDEEPIRTNSGLLLTHRKVSAPATTSTSTPSNPYTVSESQSFRDAQQDFFEVNTGNSYYSSSGIGGYGKSSKPPHSMAMVQARRFLSYMKIWVLISAVFLLVATRVFVHALGHSSSGSSSSSSATTLEAETADMQNSNAQMYPYALPDSILLVPKEDISQMAQQQPQTRRLLAFHEPSRSLEQLENDPHHPNYQHTHGIRQEFHELRQEFEQWTGHHGKKYHSNDEKESRFHIWIDNHRRTIEKNRRHGACKMTKQTVFGSNHLKDLSPEEFKNQYLTGYNGPRAVRPEPGEAKPQSPNVRSLSKHRGQVLNPDIQKRKMHESVKQRFLKHQEQTPMYSGRKSGCKWYDAACFLRWIWQSAGVSFGTIVGTMEPKFDSNAFPNSIDWRDMGAVTDVRSQGNCGACWAITAVETVESAHFIATGSLYDLSEEEIILCDDSCQMCSGGWPQNAFEWVMKYGGLPLYNTMPYDGDTMLALTEGIEGTSAYYDEDAVKSYRQSTCPGGSGGGSGSGSQDSDEYNDGGAENENYGDYTDQGRYGNIKGYGYATDRCICYSDGSGCDCDEQDEDLAVANVASYGPAVICIEASLWQDYSGGIMTSATGCGSAFLDMNHCAQVVGYAFTSSDAWADAEGYEDGNDDQSGSGSGGSQDEDGDRMGYWIVRNQWGSYWGMNGYAYVAMGENTCGILNDVTQAYLNN